MTRLYTTNYMATWQSGPNVIDQRDRWETRVVKQLRQFQKRNQEEKVRQINTEALTEYDAYMSQAMAAYEL